MVVVVVVVVAFCCLDKKYWIEQKYEKSPQQSPFAIHASSQQHVFSSMLSQEPQRFKHVVGVTSVFNDEKDTFVLATSVASS